MCSWYSHSWIILIQFFPYALYDDNSCRSATKYEIRECRFVWDWLSTIHYFGPIPSGRNKYGHTPDKKIRQRVDPWLWSADAWKYNTPSTM